MRYTRTVTKKEKTMKYLPYLALLTLLFGCEQHEPAPLADSTQHTPAYAPGDEIPALAYIEHKEIYNPEAVIPPQCYTKTDGVNNPCYACHQSYSSTEKRPNVMNDGSLQGGYEFSDLGTTNHWKNLFIDRSDLIVSITDEQIKEYVLQDNYSAFINKFKNDPNWSGEITEIENLAYPELAFDQQGIAKDGSHWIAFNYKPFPSTFWPTNGSTGDAMIRLDAPFRELKGRYSQDVYFANLALVEMALKDTQTITTIDISEIAVGVDLNNDGVLSSNINQIERRSHYLGDAKHIPLAKMLYPAHTEFLHTVRYLGVDEQGNIFNSPRMKEVRYMKKYAFRSKASLKSSYEKEIKEKQFEQLPQTITLGDRGIDNTFGWKLNAYIEDEYGELRHQHHQEMMFCNGCHRSVGASFDQTFSFPRKVDGKQGWGYINLHTMQDVPNLGESKGEFLTYLERVRGGDEFRQNQEMLERWFNPDGSVNKQKVESVESIYELITPSARRALDLNKAYLTIVKEQSYLYGRDATIVKARNVLKQVDESQAPLTPENIHQWDMRLLWDHQERADLLSYIQDSRE